MRAILDFKSFKKVVLGIIVIGSCLTACNIHPNTTKKAETIQKSVYFVQLTTGFSQRWGS